MIEQETEQKYAFYIGTLVLIDFGVYKLLEIVEYEQEPYFECASISNQIVRFSILTGLTPLKGTLHHSVDNYPEIVQAWNKNSIIKAI